MIKDKDKKILESLTEMYGADDVLNQIQNNVIVVETENTSELVVVEYISKIECAISRLKEIHWSALDDKTHVLSGELIEFLNNKQDVIAEDYMGACGEKLKIGCLGCSCYDCTNLPELLKCIREDTLKLYPMLCGDCVLSGIKATLDTIISTLNSYLYKDTQK